MKGLILSNLYTFPKARSILATLVMCSAMCVFTANTKTTTFMVFLLICSSVFTAPSRLTKEHLTGWDAYEQTLPVRKSEIILAKYISFLMYLLIYIGAGLVLLLLLAGQDVWELGLRSIMLAAAAALFVGAYIHPATLLQHNCDSSEMFINSILVAIIAMLGTWWILSAQAGDHTLPITGMETAISSLSVSAAAFIISCYCSIRIYKTKEF